MDTTIKADRQVCIGAGMCVQVAPSLFAQDRADGRVVVVRPVVTGRDAMLANDAADLCPSGALTIRRGTGDAT